MTTIRSITYMPGGRNIFACGDFNANANLTANVTTDFTQVLYTAAIFQMDNFGGVNWYLTVAGTNPIMTAPGQDRCMGVSWDPVANYLTVLLQTKS